MRSPHPKLPLTLPWKTTAFLLLLTACAGGGPGGQAPPEATLPPGDNSPTPTQSPAESAPAPTPPQSDDQPAPMVPPTDAAKLDMRYAHVLAVRIQALGQGRYRFDVTLQHDDQGEAPDFADSWQVERLEGQILGQRVLLHAHSNDPFTRSAEISIPEGVREVIVRGHDMRHGFGGQVMLVDLETGVAAPLPDPPAPP